MRNHIKWLLQQIPDWVDKGLVDARSAQLLQDKYQEQLKSTFAGLKASQFLVIAAALMIGLGVILLVAKNWYELERYTRIFLAFVPWLVSSALLFKVLYFTTSAHARAWLESSAVFQSLCNGASLAIIALLYPSGGDITKLLSLWLLMQLPLLYLTRSTGASVVYLVLLSFRAMESPTALATFWLFVALWLPFALMQIKELQHQGKYHTLIYLWSMVLIALTGVMATLNGDQQIFTILIFALFYAACLGLGRIFLARYSDGIGPGLRYRPFELVGSIGILLMAYMYTFEDGWTRISLEDGYASSLFASTTFADHALLAVLVVAWLFLLARLLLNKDLAIMSYMVFPALAVVASAVATGYGTLAAGWLFNFYLTFGICLWLIIEGSSTRNFTLLNTGIFFLIAQIMARFLSADFGILPTAIAFIFSGLLVLVLNIYVMKRQKKAI